jgi:hypothetical protein
MMAKPTPNNKVFEPPELQRVDALRPEVIVRIQLLKIVWRPDRKAADAVEVCAELEKYISGGR